MKKFSRFLFFLTIIFISADANEISQFSVNTKGAFKILCQLFSENFKEICHKTLSNEDTFTVSADIKVQLNSVLDISGASQSKAYGNKCEICQEIMTRYKKAINTSFSNNYIQNRFLQVCDIADVAFKKDCITFFKGKGLEMIEAISRSEDSIKICQIINICLGEDDIEKYNVLTDLLLINIFQQPSTKQCTNCVASLEFIEQHINSKMNPEQVQRTLFGFCEIFKPDSQTFCKGLLSPNGLKTIKGILTKSDSKELCQNLTFCDMRVVDPNTLEVINMSEVYNEIAANQKCNLCKNMIKLLEISVNKTLNATNIQNRVFYACTVFTSPLKDKCIKFYQGLGLVIIKSVLVDEDPIKVCKKLALCLRHAKNQESYQFLDLLNTFITIDSNEKCKICKIHIRWIERNYNRSKTLEQMQAVVDDFCGIFNCPYEYPCKQFYVKVGLEVREKILPRLVCQKLEFCRADEEQPLQLIKLVQSVPVAKHNTKKCSKCIWLVKRYEKVVNKSLTAEYIQSKIIDLCDIYNATVKGLCIKFYQGKGLQIIQEILSSGNPREICQIINLCMNDRESNMETNLLDLLLIHSYRKRNSDHCERCIKIIKFEEKNINNSKSLVEIQGKLIEYCSIFKQKFANVCVEYFNSTGLEVIDSILKKESPKKVCEKLHYCHKRNILDDGRQDLLSIFYQKEKDEDCKLCKKMVKYFEIAMNKSMNPTAIQQKMSNGCSIYKLSLKTQCIFFYNTVGFDVIKAVLTNGESTTICKLMDFCLVDSEAEGTQQLLNLMQMLTTRNSQKKCQLCISSVTWLEENANKENSPKFVQEVMFGVCGVLSLHYKRSCIKYYSTIGFQLIKDILNDVDPNTACRNQNLCRRKHSKFNIFQQDNKKHVEICSYLTNIKKYFDQWRHDKVMDANDKFVDVYNFQTELLNNCYYFKGQGQNKKLTFRNIEIENQCKLCKEIIYIINQLAIPIKNEETLKRAFKVVCKHLPISIYSECKTFVDKFQVRIIKLFLQNVTYHEICQRIQLCSSITKGMRKAKISNVYLLISRRKLNNSVSYSNVISMFRSG